MIFTMNMMFEVLDKLRQHLKYIDDFVNDIFKKYMDLQKGFYIPKFLEKGSNMWYETPDSYLSLRDSVDTEYFYKNLDLN